MMLLKQSTTATIQLGPFLDEDDGKTAETGLTISSTDVYLSKNGAAFANPNDTNAASHDSGGWYRKQLDGTDTGTLGRLLVRVHESGALPVWREFLVVSANVYDSLVAGSDYLQTDATQVEGSDATNQINAACDTALSDYDAPTKAEMDTAHALLATAAALTTVDTVVDAIKVVTDNLPNSGALTTLVANVAAILADTATDGVLLAQSAVDAIHLAGAGATEHTVTILDDESAAVPGADVWVTSDEAGSTVIASGTSDSNGQVTFYLDTGTVYVWAQKAGYNISNPTAVTIS
jgi:hypothetical protein